MIFGSLRNRGVLGINCRNSELISRFNPRKLYPLVDDKLRTKKLAMDHGVPVPELFGSLSTIHDIHDFHTIIDDRQDFVVKPANGSGGDGILVFDGHRDGRFRLCTGLMVSWDDLSHHLANTLNGQYSLGGHSDRVMIEYRVRFDPVFDLVSYLGVPDIRVIVFRGFPVMAMVRLPTRASHGKANLHQGAVGVGIDVATGRTLRGVLDNDFVDEHPDTGTSFSGLDVPGWETILMMAARCYELTGLGYLGVDIVLDADRGPLMLELNARPGLNIQIANSEGIMHRLQEVQALADPELTAEERIAISVGRFGCPQVAVS
ncbi:MAG: alpha-L-glutamate ligase-like protein [Chromatiales bacterium]|jgi:alpha-L-glutamate ligase-like protein|nr:alpha-L-glutamate ligase-like protein [Chromatiales bacterium]